MKTWIALLFCASVAAFGEQASAQDCQLKRVATLEVSEASNGWLLVPVMVAGKPKFFGLSPTIGLSRVTPSLVSELKLEEKSTPWALLGKGGTENTDGSVELPTFGLGGLHSENLRLLVDHADSPDPKQAGTLGLDFLTNFDVEFDLGHNEINLFSPDHCAGKVVYWADSFDSFPITSDRTNGFQFQMELDGTPIQVWLSTEARRMVLFKNTADRVFGIKMDSPSLKLVESLSPPGKTKFYSYPFNNLRIGGLNLSNPQIYIVDENGCDYGKWQFTSSLGSFSCTGGGLMLRQTELRQMRLYLAFREMTAYVTAADAHKTKN